MLRALLVLTAIAAAAVAGGCGDSNGDGEKGTYELAGTAVFSDKQDHSGIKIRIIENSSVVTTAADGSFTLPELSDGDWTLKAGRDFYSTLTARLRVRGGLLMEPIGELVLNPSFFLYIRTDSLRYTHLSDSVGIWLVLKNDDVEQLDLFSGFHKPYNFLVYDPIEGDEEIWNWHHVRPPVNDEKFDFERTIGAKDSLLIFPNRKWDKEKNNGTPVGTGDFEIQSWIDLRDGQEPIRFETDRLLIKLIP